jgi:excisionase family DNA binding protein
MARTKSTKKPTASPAPPVPATAPADVDGATTGEVLTLAEAAAYLRLPEDKVVQLVSGQGLPGRLAGLEWRFLKSAVQAWLSAPPPRYTKEAQLALAGVWEDDPDLEDMVEEIYRRRGRPITEDGSYRLFHGLDMESPGK